MKPTRKKKVFISYAREDKVHALRIKDFFEQHGVATWFDQLDSIPGALWRKAVRDAIRDADYFIALLSEVSVEKRDGFVWVEFELALKKQRAFPDNRKFIFPVLLDDVKIPKEFTLYHSVQLSDTALREILNVIETEPSPSRRIIPSWLKLLGLIVSGGALSAIIMTLNNNMGHTRLIFKATIRDTANNPIQEAYAYILGPNNDTVIKSPPSGSNGQVYFELDSNEVRATVWYYHPGYAKVSKSYTLMAHDTYRSVNLVPLPGPLAPVKPGVSTAQRKKQYLLTGLQLSDPEKKLIKSSTGYSFSYGTEAELFSVDYDRNYRESTVEGKFTFQGSEVFLLHSSAKSSTGLYFPADGLPRTKTDIEHDNAIAFNQLLQANRNVIVNTLIKCLKDY